MADFFENWRRYKELMEPKKDIFPWTQFTDFKGEEAQPVSTAVAPPEMETLTEVPSKTSRRKSQEEIFKTMVTPPGVKMAEQGLKAMASKIEGIVPSFEASRRGWVATEQGHKKLSKEQRDYYGMSGAKEAMELVLWYGGPAHTALSGVPSIYQQWLKPQIFKVLDKVKPKFWSMDKVKNVVGKMFKPGSKFSQEEMYVLKAGNEYIDDMGRVIWKGVEPSKIKAMWRTGEGVAKGRAVATGGMPEPSGISFPRDIGVRPQAVPSHFMGAGGVPTGKSDWSLSRSEYLAKYPDVIRKLPWEMTWIELEKVFVQGKLAKSKEYTDAKREFENIVNKKGLWSKEGKVAGRKVEQIDKMADEEITHLVRKAKTSSEARAKLNEYRGVVKPTTQKEAAELWKKTEPYQRPKRQIDEVSEPPQRDIKTGEVIKGPTKLPTEPPQPPAPPTGEGGGGVFGRPPMGAQLTGEPIPEPTARNAVKMVIDAIKATKPMRAELEKAYTAERGKRIKEFEEVYKGTKGQKGYFAALKKMEGELVRQPVVEALKQKLNQPVVDELYEIIKNDFRYDSFDKMTISSALTRILEGKLPQPHQYPMLEDVFGGEFVRTVLDNKNNLPKLRDVIGQFVNLPKAVKASFDLSAPYRQAIYWMLRPTQIGLTAPAMKHMFKMAFSEKAYTGWYKEIGKDPIYNKMRKHGLDITDPTGAYKLSAKEEAFMTDIPKIVSETPFLKYTPIGWAGKGIRVSERAFTGFLNKLRFDASKSLFQGAVRQGFDPTNPAHNRVFKSITKYVNTTTGRGDIHKLAHFAQELNALLWSPRFIKARLDVFNPRYYKQLHPTIRKKLVLGMMEALGMGSLILGLASLVGKKAGVDVSVEMDPRSTDFGKLKIGRTRWDIWGGHQQYMRVLAQITSNRRKTSQGKMVVLGKKQFPFETRLDVLERFGRGKLAPLPQLALELFAGQKLYGDELVPLEELRQTFIPMVAEDIIEAYDEVGPSAFLSVGVPATFGVGVQTYEDRKRRSIIGTDNWKKAQELK